MFIGIFNLHCHLILPYIAGSDFDAITEPEVVFTSTNSQQPICRTVTLINDQVSEGTEFFMIEMSTSMERVDLDDPAQVTVSDDDGQHTTYSKSDQYI